MSKGYYYQYKSRFTKEPCVAIVTLGSGNRKTGNMAQVWFLAEDTPPHERVKAGADACICGPCPWRAGNGCYVVACQAPLAVWKAYHSGNYLPIERSTGPLELPLVRFGAYGDPGSMSYADWRHLTYWVGAKRWTGYTHAWRSAPWLIGECMASTSVDDNHDALSHNWSTFLTLPKDCEAPETCPAATKGITCAQCMRCHGRSITGRQITIAIKAHGAKAKRI